MIKKEVLKRIIRDFHKSKIPQTKKRKLSVPVNSGKIITLSGVRRSGKTFTLYETIKALQLQEVALKKILYINFEDERLELKQKDLDLILQSYRELYPEFNLSECYFFFDEIQNISGWERFIRRINDTITKNIFITGSNSKLLSRDIATTLRGRTITFEIFPLSFDEYLTFNNIKADIYHSATRSKIANLFENFIFNGGFPELTTIKDASLKNKILQEYFDVMLYKDLVERFGITNIIALKYFIRRIFENITSLMSVNKIYNELKSAGYKIGKNTLYDFLEAAEAIYLFQQAKKYSQSVLKHELGQKKIYVIDNGLLNAQTFKFSKDYGKLLENLIFVELLKKQKEISFYKNKNECDFIIVEKTKVKQIIQVSYSISDPDTKKREINSLISTCEKFGQRNGYIITFAEEANIKVGKITIKVSPAYKFLLRDL